MAISNRKARIGLHKGTSTLRLPAQRLPHGRNMTQTRGHPCSSVFPIARSPFHCMHLAPLPSCCPFPAPCKNTKRLKISTRQNSIRNISIWENLIRQMFNSRNFNSGVSTREISTWIQKEFHLDSRKINSILEGFQAGSKKIQLDSNIKKIGLGWKKTHPPARQRCENLLRWLELILPVTAAAEARRTTRTSGRDASDGHARGQGAAARMMALAWIDGRGERVAPAWGRGGAVGKRWMGERGMGRDSEQGGRVVHECTTSAHVSSRRSISVHMSWICALSASWERCGRP